MIDTYRHKGMRKNMLDELRQKGIEDERVLEAMDNKEFFEVLLCSSFSLASLVK